MSRRFSRLLLVGLLLLLSTGGIMMAGHLWLTKWVSTQGKAWLEAQLEGHLPVDVAIGAMRYSWWQGFLLSDVTAVDRTTAAVWVDAPETQVHVSVWSFLFRREASFRLKANLQAPCDTRLTMSGRYGVKTRQLALEVLTTDIEVDRLSPVVAQRLPALKSGQVRVKARITAQPDQAPRISGRLVGTALVWEQPPTRITTDVIADGTISPPIADAAPWQLDVRLAIARGSVEGLPAPLKTIQELTGTLHLTHESLEILAAEGTALNARWQLEGTIAPLRELNADLVLRAPIALRELANFLGQDVNPVWQPEGDADLILVCRGPLTRWPDVELMARATLRDASLTVPKFPQPLTRLTGILEYDHLTQRLATESLAGRLQDAPLTARGEVRLTTPAVFDAQIETDADLGLLQAWLPAGSPIDTAGGPVSVRVALRGTTERPRWYGAATFNGARLTLRHPAKTLEELRGTIRFSDQDLSTEALELTMEHEPATLSGTLTELHDEPRFAAQLRFSSGSLTLHGLARRDAAVIEAAELVVGASRLRAEGRISRTAGQPSQLSADGTVELSDLLRLPWVNTSGLKAWDPKGQTDVHVRLTGPLDQWQTLTAQGTLSAEQLQLHGFLLRRVAAELEQGQGRFGLRLLEASLADGKLTGEYAVDLTATPARYLLEADLTLAQLDQLAASVPAWRDRRLQGIFSGHASVLGTWKDRAGLRGDGWVLAEGDRLLELPLLDRLFRGVFGALADRLGLTTLRKAEIVRVTGQWQLAQERIRTEDFRVTGLSGTEPVTLVVRGSVGLDKTLDLVVEPEFSEQLMLQAPTMSALSATILKVVGGMERIRSLVGRHRVTGTIDRPEYKFEFSLDQLLTQTLPVQLDRLLDAVR